jgi:hypothetical protein
MNYNTIGGRVNPTDYNINLDPYRARAAQADDAYAIAAEMLGPLYGGGAGGMGGNMFTNTASRLDQIGGQANPGMSDDEFLQAQRAIMQSSRQRRAEMANQMGGGASGMDPSVYYRASQGLQGQQDAAMGQLYSNRAALNRQAILAATQALAPYYQTQEQGYQNYQNQLGALAGEIMGGAESDPTYAPIQVTTEYGSGAMI